MRPKGESRPVGSGVRLGKQEGPRGLGKKEVPGKWQGRTTRLGNTIRMAYVVKVRVFWEVAGGGRLGKIEGPGIGVDDVYRRRADI